MPFALITAIGSVVGRDPWQILADSAKIETLKRMIQSQLETTVPKVMSGQ